MPPKTNDFLTTIFLAVFFVIVIGGCAIPGTVMYEDDLGAVIIESKGKDRHYPYEDEQGDVVIEHRGEEHYYPRKRYSVPPGHMPPPGKCRIWYPDLPPGQQPPPGNCENLRYQVPPDAWLIEG